MPHNAFLKEGKGSYSLGAINDLGRDNKIPGFDVFLQTANGRKGDHGPDANRA